MKTQTTSRILFSGLGLHHGFDCDKVVTMSILAKSHRVNVEGLVNRRLG